MSSPLEEAIERFAREESLGRHERALLERLSQRLYGSDERSLTGAGPESDPDGQPTVVAELEGNGRRISTDLSPGGEGAEGQEEGGEEIALMTFLEGDIPEMARGTGLLSQHAISVPTLNSKAEGPRPIAPGALELSEGYEDRGRLGMGGMAEVRRVFDAKLGRTMAIKLLHKNLLDKDILVARFIEEAQVTAQLQHPGIVPVHDLGRLPDGKYYFTMKEVEGRTLRQLIKALHKAVVDDGWQPTPDGWTFRKVIQGFKQVCDAVAYAHARGVVHRDIKPANIMLGDFGEVLVLDWGIAKVLGSGGQGATGRDVTMDPVVTQRTQDETQMTRYGTVPGTPAYMPPEQAMGEQVGLRADVYALGAVLYEILSGRPPYRGDNPMALMAALCKGPPEPVGRHITQEAAPIPEYGLQRAPVRSLQHIRDALCPPALRELCEWAMAREQGDRPADAGVLAAELEAWLEGARRQEEAQEIVNRAAAMEPTIRELRLEARRLSAQAEAELKEVRPHEPTAKKEPIWALQDRAAALRREADLKEVTYLQDLRGALVHAPEHPEAHQRLAQYYRDQHEEAEVRREQDFAAQVALLLQSHDRVGRHAPYLKGDGALTLHTDPPGAEVELFRFVSEGRRLGLEKVRHLGVTPIERLSIPMGSYVLRLRAPRRLEVSYPVHIGRGEHWHGIRPGESAPHPIYLPKPREISADDRYVPGGWFTSGGDPDAPSALPRRRVWVESFVMRRYPVTNREYIVFLNDLVARGHEETALRWAPRDRGASAEEEGPMLFGRDAKGRFFLQVDADGDEWFPMAPVVMVNWASAKACAAWCRGRTRQGWRLPYEMEWEKAARGVDGRFFPWGDFIDPTWACIRDSHEERPSPKLVTDFPLDLSVYGVQGLAGNINEWCLDVFDKGGPPLQDGRFVYGERDGGEETLRVNKGGSWFSPPRDARVCDRKGYQAGLRYANLGLRLVRSFP